MVKTNVYNAYTKLSYIINIPIELTCSSFSRARRRDASWPQGLDYWRFGRNGWRCNTSGHRCKQRYPRGRQFSLCYPNGSFDMQRFLYDRCVRPLSACRLCSWHCGRLWGQQLRCGHRGSSLQVHCGQQSGSLTQRVHRFLHISRQL